MNKFLFRLRIFLFQLLSNPDGTASTKRFSGFLTLTAALILGFVAVFKIQNVNTEIFLSVFFGLLGYSATCFGLTSVDLRGFAANKTFIRATQENTSNETNLNNNQSI